MRCQKASAGPGAVAALVAQVDSLRAGITGEHRTLRSHSAGLQRGEAHEPPWVQTHPSNGMVPDAEFAECSFGLRCEPGAAQKGRGGGGICWGKDEIYHRALRLETGGPLKCMNFFVPQHVSPRVESCRVAERQQHIRQMLVSGQKKTIGTFLSVGRVPGITSLMSTHSSAAVATQAIAMLSCATPALGCIEDDRTLLHPHHRPCRPRLRCVGA